LSRGWAEILTGKVGWDTRAYYMSPCLDGSHRFSESFHLSDLLSNPDVNLLWKTVGDRGYKVGIMNAPTTTPAAKLNGFLIGSAGGGLGEVKGYPNELFYPKSILDTLKNNEYIVDTRLLISGIKDIKTLFNRVNEMEARRTNTFIELCKQQGTDFGFIVNTGIRTIQYLAMSEIESLIDASENNNKLSDHLLTFNNLLEDLYRKLDHNIEQLIHELKPDHIIITADHGQSPFKYKANINVFLEQHGWLKKQSNPSANITSSIQKYAKKYLSRRFIKSLQRIAPKEISTRPPSFNQEISKAFGHYYISGIYINDTRRFNGPIKEGHELDTLVYQICDTFNNTSEADTFSMKAVPFRSKHCDTNFSDYLPDILIEKPDSIFFSGDGNKLIYPNPSYGPIPDDLKIVGSDMYSGIKGRHPILLMDNKTSALLRDDDPTNLTVVYKLIDRIFSKN
jgi:predicted AlkP superfamily phosphohydrolase/phosphomutase